jgi:hypothetical protein
MGVILSKQTLQIADLFALNHIPGQVIVGIDQTRQNELLANLDRPSTGGHADLGSWAHLSDFRAVNDHGSIDDGS